MVHHEIANDTFGGENVAVTYCPLTGTAMGYKRGGTTFGVDGVLINSMWRRWRDEYPETLVLTDDTGYVRNYDSDPYGSYSYGPGTDPASGYYVNEDVIYPLMNDDNRFGSKEVFVCARDSDKKAVVFRKESPRCEGELAVETGSGEYVAVYEEALDTASIERSGEPLVAFDAMWFAWAAFYPETETRGRGCLCALRAEPTNGYE